MKDALSKFFVVKTAIYMIGFSILWYLFFTKVPNSSVEEDTLYQTWVNQVCLSDRCFDIEVADEENERKQWLMYREQLSSQSGMLFVFQEEKIYPFWMKNTLIPLDMIWIGKDWKVIDIQTAQPCKKDPCPSYIPSWSGLYVLEINAWLSSLLWIEEWSKLQFVKK